MKNTLKHIFAVLLGMLAVCTVARGKEFHVAIDGNDSNAGTKRLPFRTIQHAADLAQPGDVITVHAGIYRERISPPRGGTSEKQRIVYQAAAGEIVGIRGSEVIKNWTKIQDDVWKVTIPNPFFGNFNPYSDIIHGDWFDPQGRVPHTGAVYLQGNWLTEAAKLDDVLKPGNANALWFGQVDKTNTVIWAQFKDVNPNDKLVEINVRQTVFYPRKEGINYLTVHGFVMEDAATPWAPPTAEQIGLLGTHWSKGWIIENNVIRNSVCSGISLGKYGDEWDNKSANSAEGYVKTIERAEAHGWSKENIGHHLVRNNTISHCEQAGIVGSLGAVFSTITGNTIHDIHVRKLFTGAEMAGIKFHGAIDVTISHNHIYQTCLGLWLDWMAQGTRISGNLFHDNGMDVFVEVDHGPFLFDNNFCLSPGSLASRSQGGAYVNNLFAGAIDANAYDGRQTPFLKPHSTQVAGYHDNPCGDDRYYNNVFMNGNLSEYNTSALPVWMGGNVFLKGASPSAQEKEPLVKAGFDPQMKLSAEKDGFYIQIGLNKNWAIEQPRQIVTTKLLGKAAISNEAFENADGSSIRIDRDYFGKQRNNNHPFPGPIEVSDGGKMRKIW